MENVKLHLNSLYGKFADRPIYIDTDEIVEVSGMEMWMEHLTHEDVRRIRLVSQALGWTPERVVKTPFTTIILQLACKVIEMKTDKEYKDNILLSIEKFLEENKK